MMYNNINNKEIRAILTERKDAFRGLHEAEGFDFNAPFSITKFHGKYTINGLLNAHKHYGVTPDNYKMVVVTGKLIDPEKSDIKCYHGLRYIILNEDGKYDIEPTERSYLRDNIGTFYRKADFEGVRKSMDAIAFVISQSKTLLKYPETKGYCHTGCLHPWERVKITPVKTEYFTRYKLNYIDRNIIREERWIDELDKSGYNKDNAENRLERKLKEIRANRKKQEYLAVDYSHKINAISELIKALKNDIIKDIEKAVTYSEIKKASERLSGWNGLQSVIYNYETFKEYNEEKKYSSVAVAERDYNDIMNQIRKLEQKEA